MARSLVGSGVALDHTTNYGTMIDVHRAVNPTTMLGMVDAYKDSPKIWQLSKDLPDAKIIARVYHEHEGGYAQPPSGPGDTRPMIAEPESILNEQVELGRNGKMWLHVMNEPSLFMKAFEVQRTIDWLVKFIGLAAPENCYCVLGNFADRHPAIIGGMWDPITWPLLRKIAEFPKLMKLGLHFYGPDALDGVIVALNETCKELRIEPPQVVGTEFGLDSTGPDDTKNGFDNRGMTGEGFVQWQYGQVQGPLKRFFASGQLVGLQTFQWNPLWGAFNIANNEGYQKAYKKAAAEGKFDVSITTTKPTYKAGVAPDTLKGGHYYKVGMPAGLDLRNLREMPDGKSGDIGDVLNNDVVCLFDEPIEYDSLNRKWQWCIVMKGHEVAAKGWLWTDGIQLIATTKPEPPVVVIPTPPTAPTDELVKYTYKLEFTILAPRLNDAQQAGMTNALKALLAAAAWMGKSIGTNEIEVDAELANAIKVAT